MASKLCRCGRVIGEEQEQCMVCKEHSSPESVEAATAVSIMLNQALTFPQLVRVLNTLSEDTPLYTEIKRLVDNTNEVKQKSKSFGAEMVRSMFKDYERRQ